MKPARRHSAERARLEVMPARLIRQLFEAEVRYAVNGSYDTLIQNGIPGKQESDGLEMRALTFSGKKMTRIFEIA